MKQVKSSIVLTCLIAAACLLPQSARAQPNPAHLAIMAGWAVASFLVGYVIFMKRRTMFADVV